MARDRSTLSREPLEGGAASTHGTALPTEPAAILVVEPNTAARKTIQRALESRGYQVLAADNGAVAVDWARRHRVNLVLQALELPDIDGLDLVTFLRDELGYGVPILCLTGLTTRAEELRAVRGGFAAVLVKPINPMTLLEGVGSHLSRRRRSLPARVTRHRRVLVVDDDPIQLEDTRLQLADAGFDVTATSSADLALERVRSEKPDAVISDVLMPGVDGFELCRAIRHDRELASTPVILVSSHRIVDADRAIATRVGAEALIVRDLESRELVRQLEATFGATSSARALAPTPTAPDPAETELETAIPREHERRVLWQLERQALLNADLVQRCSMQAAQLAVLAGAAEALARNKALDGVLGEVLSMCMDVIGISKGALYMEEPDGRLALKEGVGFASTDEARLARCFDHEEALRDVMSSGKVTVLPSASVASEVSRHLLTELAVTTALIAPVLWSSEVRGALLLGARSADISSEESTAFAGVLGMQVAQAMGLAQTFKRLALAEERYRTLMEGAHDPVSVLTPEGTFLEVNRRWEELLQLPRDRIVGHPIQEFLAPDSAGEEMTTAVSGAAQRPRAWTQSMVVRRADGAPATLDVSNVLLDIGGERVVFAISRDVTEQVLAQEQLMISDRMASIGLLSAGLAHEINNPLAVAVANLGLAADEVTTLAKQGVSVSTLDEEIGDAREATERVRQIALDLRLFSRSDREQDAAVDIRKVLESALRIASSEIRQRARLVTKFLEVPPVAGNASRFGQVFLNLLVNAVQALPDGHADEHEIRVAMSPDGPSHVTVEVTDTGPGIPPEILRHLFTPFFTTKPPGVGTGLGLSICERIVAAAGGEISVDSRVGHGTTFKVRLATAPRVPATANPPVSDRSSGIKAAELASTPPRRGRVLVVEDDSAVIKAIERTLTPNHRVVAVTTAVQALAQIKGGERFDVILCDMTMPDMSGMDLHGALRAAAPDQAEKMVFLTGDGFTESGRAFLGRIPNARVDKPFDAPSLLAIVNRQLN